MNALPRVSLLLAILLSTCWVASGLYPISELKTVPLDRLFANLRAQLAKAPNNFVLNYDLARLHAMTYATGATNRDVRTADQRPYFGSPANDSGVPRIVVKAAERLIARRHLTNAILFYERAIKLLKVATNAPSEKEWLVLPLELGRAWCLDQSGDRPAALVAYRTVLKLAWQKEVTGEFNFSEWVRGVWNAATSGQNPLNVRRQRNYLSDLVYSEEIIGYLLNLLHPVQDAKEIAELNERMKTLSSMGRLVTPIVVPIGDETSLDALVNPHAAVSFDLDGSGVPRPWSWLSPQAAWLVWDPEADGHITSGLQMFGQVTFWIGWFHGFQALSSLDDNHDGVLRDDELRGLALWHDANADGVSDRGEVRSVADWKITELDCRGEQSPAGDWWCPRGVTFGRGRTLPTYDWIAASPSPHSR